jgi:hypothetical protein
MDCAVGEEWNFAYVLPQEDGKPVTLVVPTSLQMGWVEPPHRIFAQPRKTSCDVTTEYIKTKISLLPSHKFEHYAVDSPN